jgi:hypothetical protein
MPNTKRQFERRKHKRCQVPTGSFVALRSNGTMLGQITHGTILGQITDISMDGLGFRYIDVNQLPEESSLDIFVTEHDFCLGLRLDRVPFKTVTNYDIPNTVVCKIVDGLPPSCKSMKRGGVQFGELTPEQTGQLEFLIWNCRHRGTARDNATVRCQTNHAQPAIAVPYA